MINLTIIVALAFAIFLVLAVFILALDASFGRHLSSVRPPVKPSILNSSGRAVQRVPFEPYKSNGNESALTPGEDAWFASSDSSHAISNVKKMMPALSTITPVKSLGSFNCTLFDDEARPRRSTMALMISTVKPLLDVASSDETKGKAPHACTVVDVDTRPPRSTMASSIPVTQLTVPHQTLVKMDTKTFPKINWDKTKIQKATRASTPSKPYTNNSISTTNLRAPNVSNRIKMHHTTPCTIVGAHKPVQRLMYNVPPFNPKSTKKSPPTLSLPLPALGNINNTLMDDIEAQIPSSPSQCSFSSTSSSRFSSLVHALSQKARDTAFASDDIKPILAQKFRACRSSLVNHLDRVSNPHVLPLANGPHQQIDGGLRDWLRSKAVSAFASSMDLQEDDSDSFKFKLDEQDQYFLMSDEGDVSSVEAYYRTSRDDTGVIDYARMSHEEFFSVFLEEE